MIWIFLITQLLWAQQKSAGALTTELKADFFRGQLKEGFHFNDKAPNQIMAGSTTIKPQSLKTREIDFKLPKNLKSAQAQLYVCDDAITFCETHKVAIGSEKSAPTSSVSNGSAKKGTTDRFGFIHDDFKKALSQAKKKKQLVMIDFSARWCPGCIRYEKEIFPTRAFKNATEKLVKLKIDVDLFDNFELAEKFDIKGIPTMVIVNSDGDEVSRLVDFHFNENLKKFISATIANPLPMKELLLREDPALKTQLGLRLVASGQWQKAVEILSKIQPPPPELLYAQVSLAQENFEKDPQAKLAYAQELRSALLKEGDSSRSIGWRAELLKLIDTQTEEAKKILYEGRFLADSLLKDSELMKRATKNDFVGEFMGYEGLLVGMYKADLIEAAGLGSKEVIEAWEQAAELGKAYKIPPKKSGPALRYLIVLTAAKKYSEAEAWADQILKGDPQNIDVKRRKMKILLAQNKFEETEKIGEKIIDRAEGRNQFWVAESLAKAYIGGKKMHPAKRLLTAYLGRAEIQTDKMKSVRKSMEELLKSVE